MIPRYYAQYIDENLDVGWFVFDRELTARQGSIKHICRAINRHQAFLIRDALNAPSR